MARIFATVAAAVALFACAEAVAPVPKGTWPASKGTVTHKGPILVKKGEVFDGKMKTYERSDITCQGQKESGKDTAMFLVEAGGTLKNVIIGKNQMEGVHCDQHDCTIENVWWSDVCEDALSVKGGTAKSVTRVIGGGARYADDKIVQHNSYGTVHIEGFYAQDFGKLYRSCGNGSCGVGRQRHVTVTNVYAVNPKTSLVIVNKNNGDTAKFNNVYIKSSKGNKAKVCKWSEAVSKGEPKELGDGPSGTLCQYSASTVHFNAPARLLRDVAENETQA